MHTGKITDQDIQLIKMLKAADDAEERKRKPAEFKPAPRTFALAIRMSSRI